MKRPATRTARGGCIRWRCVTAPSVGCAWSACGPVHQIISPLIFALWDGPGCRTARRPPIKPARRSFPGIGDAGIGAGFFGSLHRAVGQLENGGVRDRLSRLADVRPGIPGDRPWCWCQVPSPWQSGPGDEKSGSKIQVSKAVAESVSGSASAGLVRLDGVHRLFRLSEVQFMSCP